MKDKLTWVVIILIIITNFGLVYRNYIISKEIRTLREECYLLTVWNKTITDSLERSLSTIKTMKNDIEELKKKSKTFY